MSEVDDVSMAIQYYRRQFPRNLFGDVCPPVILVSQLYSTLRNRTEVDLRVAKMLERKQLRSVKLKASKQLNLNANDNRRNSEKRK
jgi:hypothetical protein